MKLLIAFIRKEDGPKLLRSLRDEKISVTSMESEGGFLRQKNLTLLMALSEQEVIVAKRIIEEICKSHTERIDTTFAAGDIESVGLPSQTDVVVGGATILILDIAEKIKI